MFNSLGRKTKVSSSDDGIKSQIVMIAAQTSLKKSEMNDNTAQMKYMHVNIQTLS